jgi:DNA invertase Pin-like site-specific DNA recombinase
MNCIGYLRVSTTEQTNSGAGIKAQRTAILAEAQRRGWSERDIDWIEDSASGKSTKRPGLQLALQALKNGDASALMVSKMDRLSRSLLDFTAIMATAQRQGWSLIALDSPADTSSATGEAMANVLMTFAQLERRLIGERTKSALAEKRAEGVVLGRPRELPTAVRRRIAAERLEDRSFAAIAAALNAEKIATAHKGKCWYPSTVRAVALTA